MDNIIVVSLLALLVVLQAIGIYLLFMRKRFKIRSDTATQDIEKFLNSLDEEMSERSYTTEKHLQMFTDALKKYEYSTTNLMYEVKTNNIELINKIVQDVTTSQNEMKKIISVLNEMLKSHLEDVSNNIRTMKAEVNAVKELTLLKEDKIRRYEEGYDQKVIKNFRQEFFKILHYIEMEKMKDDSKALAEVFVDLELLLEDVGIEKINIDVGQKYDENAKMAAIKETIPTDSIEKDGIIAEVLRDGYYIQIADGNIKVLRPSEIVTYKYINIENENSIENNNMNINEDILTEQAENKKEGK